VPPRPSHHRPPRRAQPVAADVQLTTPDDPGSAADESLLEEVANPIERLKLLSGDDERIARYLDALEVTGPRERELLTEISRTRPLARPDRFPTDHRQMVEALESLARHGYRGTTAGARLGPLRPVARYGVQLVARYLVVSHIRDVSTTMRNLYALREIQALPGTAERRELRRARMDGERMVDALRRNSIGLPTFLVGGAAVSILTAIGRASGRLSDERWALALGIAGTLIALAASWMILRAAALASRRIRLATEAPIRELWSSIGWCGRPPRGQTRTFVVLAVTLTIGAWILVPILIGIAAVT
jgi:hypothetical protein